MKKAAFIFDTIIVQKNDGFYGMTLNYEFFRKRYLSMYDSIIVSTRVKKSSEVKGTDGYKKLNGKNVEFIPISNYNTIPDAIVKKRLIVSELENVINSVDIVIIRMPSVLGILAAKICNKNSKKYIVEMVACAWDGYFNHRNIFGKIVAPVMFYETKKCIKIAPNVLYVTNEFLQRRYPSNGKTCACSDVELKSVEAKVLEDRLNKISCSNIKTLNFCTVANVEMKYKGHVYMFKAMQLLKKYGYEINYYLIGNGNPSYLKNISKKLDLEHNVFFLGSLPHDDVFKKISTMDVYVQPSLQEGLPRALVEAMSIGMPAIGSDAGGIPELLQSDYVFKKRNVKELVRIIKALNVASLEQMARYNYDRANDFMPEQLNEIREKFYNEVK